MLTEKDYCDYDTCVALKELGFRERCVAYYDTADNVGLLYNTQYTCDVIPCQYDDLLESRNTATEDEVDAPTLYDVQKWLRENHNLHISTKPYPNEGGLMWMFEIRRFTPQIICVDVNKTGFYDSEEALLDGIKEAVKILKEESK